MRASEIKLHLPKEIYILGNRFRMVYEKDHNGGSFNLFDGIMTIGIRSMKDDPLYTYTVISHEVMEAIYLISGMRYDNPRLENVYLFNFNHQQFENAIQIHSEVMVKFFNYHT